MTSMLPYTTREFRMVMVWSYDDTPDPRGIAHDRIASTDQHPIDMDTK